MVIFTLEELQSFTLHQLKILATYYKLSYNKNVTKEELITPLLDILYRPDLPDSNSVYMEEQVPPITIDGVPVSARVKRIYEINKKGDTNVL